MIDTTKLTWFERQGIDITRLLASINKIMREESEPDVIKYWCGIVFDDPIEDALGKLVNNLPASSQWVLSATVTIPYSAFTQKYNLPDPGMVE